MASATDRATATTERLARATDAQLQRIAQYNRPRWQTRTVRAIAMENESKQQRGGDEGGDGSNERGLVEGLVDEEASRTGGSERVDKHVQKEVQVGQQQIDVLDGASLADVRKLITTFCAATIPRRFVFQLVHRQRELGVEVDERGIAIEQALANDGTLTVLVSPPISKHGLPSSGAGTGQGYIRGDMSHSVPVVTTSLPSFSAARIQFGDVAAKVDVYIHRSDGVTLELSAFSVQNGTKLDGLLAEQLTIQVSSKLLADHVGMTEGMASILLSTSRGRTEILKKLLGRLQLWASFSEDSSEFKQLQWKWAEAQNDVDDFDLHANRRIRVQPPSQPHQAVDVLPPKESDRAPEKLKTATTATLSIGTKIDEARHPDVRTAHGSNRAIKQDPVAANTDNLAETITSAVPSEPSVVTNLDVSPDRRVQDHALLGRKSSVDVNISSVRSCLGISTLVTSSDTPSCFAVQMVFIELMLRDFSTVSLPVFASELRPIVKDIYRSSSQPPTPEIVMKSVNLLWAGLKVALWESKMSQITTHFEKVTMELIAELRVTLGKAQCEGFRLTPLPAVPRRVECVLRALSVLRAGEKHGSMPLEKVVVSLGLNVPTSKKRLKIFDLLQQKKLSWSTLTSASQASLIKYAEEAELTSPISSDVESTFSFTVLRDSLIAVLNIVDFDLRKYVQRTDLLSGDAVKALQRDISTALMRSEERSLQITSMKSTKMTEAIVQSAMAWATEIGLNDEEIDRLKFLLQFHGADPARWYKASKDCDMLASCPRPSRLRWYIEPKSKWCELHDERYTIVGEVDLAFEFLYMEYEDVKIGTPDSLESTLVRRALAAWFGFKETPQSAGNISPSLPRSNKRAFGVNYRFGGHPMLSVEGFPALAHVLGHQHIDSLVIGCSHSRTDSSQTVALRCFVQENYALQQGWSMPVFLQRVQQSNDVQRRLAEFGAVSLVRFLALRGQHARDPVVSLKETVRMGNSEAHMAFQGLLRNAGRHQQVVLAPAVTHTALDLIIRGRVDLKYGCDFLSSLRTFVQESSATVISTLMNQRFERLQDDQDPALFPEPDVYDILWRLASRRDIFPAEWSSTAHHIVTSVFFAEEILTDARIFQYSLLVSHDEMMLQVDHDGRLIVIHSDESEVLHGGRQHFFQRIFSVVRTASRLIMSPDASNVAVKSKLDLAVQRIPVEDAVCVIEGLLSRYFAVVRTKHGLSRLGMSAEIIPTLVDMLYERNLSFSMAMLAAEHVGVIARMCKHDHEFQRIVIEIRFVEHMVEAAWSVKNSETSARLLQSLAEFLRVEEFLRQVLYALSRLVETPLRRQSLLQNIVPVVADAEDAVCIARLGRFNHQLSNQHQLTSVCSCPTSTRPISNEEVQLSARKIAAKTVGSMLDRAVSRISIGSDGSTLHAISPAVRFRKAAQIQRSVLKWLYTSRPVGKRILRATRRSRSCELCGGHQSFIAGVLGVIHRLDFAVFDQSEETARDVVAILRCIQAFVQSPELSLVLASDFRLHCTLLTLASHKSPTVRGLALSSLAELTWHSSEAFEFASSRFSKLLWRNYAVVLQHDMPQFCSWIEYAVHFAIGRLDKVSNAYARTQQPTSTVGALQQIVERDSVASMVAVLSFDGKNSDVILRITPLVTSSMNEWICDETPDTHLKLLLAVQNAIMHAPSLSGMTDLALNMFDDFSNIRTTCGNDTLTRSVTYGIMWMLCTHQQIRRQVVIRLPNAIANANADSNQSTLAELLNAVGLIATVSVDSPVTSLSGQYLEQLYEVYATLCLTLSTCHKSAGASSVPSQSTSADRSNSQFHPPNSLWARRHARFNLLPYVGTLDCLVTWHELVSQVLDQIFRSFSVVVACRTYPDPLTTVGLKCYVKAFGHQVRRGGASADFALKTLSQVFRGTNTVPRDERRSKRAGSAEDLSVKSTKIAMSDDQVSVIVDVLGGVIGGFSDAGNTGEGMTGRAPMKAMRRAILALWELQVLSHRAQSLSYSITHRLVELMHDVEADDNLRIAIVGLLVKMYRSHPRQRLDYSEASANNQIQSRVLRVIMGDVPVVMDILRPFATNRDSATLIRPIEYWSPLSLDTEGAITSNAANDRLSRLEVVAHIRWPVEVLCLLCGSVFFEKVEIHHEYYDVLIELLLRLDSSPLRKMSIRGRDEAVLGVATILRAFSGRLNLTKRQTQLCVQALFDSESIMTYASDLAAVCHAAIEATGLIFDFGRHQESNLLVASLRFIQAGDLRLDLLGNCLDLMATIASTMGEKAFMEKIASFEKSDNSAVAILFGQMIEMFQGPMRSAQEWVICQKGMKFFRELLMWQAFFDRFVRAQHLEHRLLHKSSVASTATYSSDAERPRPYPLDKSTRAVLQMALALLNFKYWCDEMPSAFHSSILLTSANANAILVRLLQDFGEGSRDTMTLLALAGDAFSPSSPHRVVATDLLEDPLELLVGVVSNTFFSARAGVRNTSQSRELHELILRTALNALVLLASLHRVRHTIHLSRFFVQNYAFPVFGEEYPQHIEKLVRLYRLCCCNAYVYRIIRLGKKSLWAESSHDQDKSFFGRLGAAFRPDSRRADDGIIQLRSDIALFLVQQDFSIFAMPEALSTPVDSEPTSSDQDVGMINPADEATTQICLRDHFILSPSPATLTDAVQEFEAGLMSDGIGTNTGSIPGILLCNELIDVVTSLVMNVPNSDFPKFRCSSAREDISMLFALVHRLVDALKSGGEQVVSENSWARVLLVLETSFLNVADLHALLKILWFPTPTMVHGLDSRPAAALHALTARLGHKGTRNFGLDSCRSTLAFVREWVDHPSCKIAIQLTSVPHWIDRILDMMSWLNLGEDVAALGENAFWCFVAVAGSASATLLRWILQTMNKWQPSDRPRPSMKVTDARVDPVFESSWRVLLQYLYEDRASVSARTRSSCLQLIRAFALAQPQEVASELVKHNAVPFLVQHLYDPDQGLAKDALSLVHCVCIAAPVAANTLCSFMLSSTQQLYFEGPLVPLRGEVIALGDEAPDERRRDQVKIADLLMRQPMCSGMTPFEILDLASNATPVRFQPGDSIPLAGSSSEHMPLLIVASGTVQWDFNVVNCTSGDSVFNESMRLGKGTLLGARSAFVARKSDRFDTTETASAVSDVVCIIVSEQSPMLRLKTSEAISRASGAWHRWLRPRYEEDGTARSRSHLGHLVSLVRGDFGSDGAVQLHATELLHLVCSYVWRDRPGSSDTELHSLWVVLLILPLLERSAVPRVLRLEIFRLITHLSTQSPRNARWKQEITSLGRGSNHVDGIVVLGRAFQVSVTDRECVEAWLRSITPLVDLAENDGQSIRRVQALVGAMGQGVILQVVQQSITTAGSAPYSAVWSVLRLICRIRHQLIHLLSALTDAERSELAHELVNRIENSHDKSRLVFLATLSKMTIDRAFCVALWSLQSSAPVDVERLLQLFVLPISLPECTVVQIVHVLSMMAYSLKVSEVPMAIRRAILVRMHKTHISWTSHLTSAAMGTRTPASLFRLDVILCMAELICVLNYSRSCMKQYPEPALVEDMMQAIVQARWVLIISEEARLVTTMPFRPRAHAMKLFSSLRILFSSRYQQNTRIEDVVSSVNILLDAKGRAQRRYSQCYPVILAGLQIGDRLGDTAFRLLLAQELQSVERFFDANAREMNEMSCARRDFGPLVQRMLLLRGASALWKRQTSNEDNFKSAKIVSWFLDRLRQSTCTSQIHRIVADCLAHLVHRDASVQQFVSTHGIEAVLPPLFASLSGAGARWSKVRLLYQVCSCIGLLPNASSPEITPMRTHVSAWMEVILQVTLEREYDLDRTRLLVSIVRWLLGAFSLGCFSSSTAGAAVEIFIQRVLSTLVNRHIPSMSASSQLMLEAANDGIEVISKILSITSVSIGDSHVLKNFIESILLWMVKVAETTSSRCEEEYTLIFSCMTATCQLHDDGRYSSNLDAFLRSDGSGLITTCEHLLLRLESFEMPQRCLVLNTVLIATRARNGSRTREAQMLLHSAWSQDRGWSLSLRSNDLVEQSQATAIVRLMCAENDELTLHYIQPQEALLRILHDNLHRCREEICTLARSPVGRRLTVTSLLHHTSALLCRLVRALATIRSSISRSFFDEILSTVGALEMVVTSRQGAIEPLGQIEANAVVSTCRLFKSCLKYHRGFCRKLVAGHHSAVLTAIFKCLVSLVRQPATLDQCAGILKWVARSVQGERHNGRAEPTLVAKEAFTDLFIELLSHLRHADSIEGAPLTEPGPHCNVQLLQALHAQMALAAITVNADVTTLLSERGVSSTSLQVLLDLYPSFVPHVSHQVVVQLIGLVLDTAVDDAASTHLITSVRRVVEKINEVNSNENAAVLGPSQDVGKQCQLIVIGNLLCHAILVRSPFGHLECRQCAAVLLETTAQCLQRCYASQQTQLLSKIAVAAARFMKALHAGKPPQLPTVCVSSLLEMIAVEPTWQLAWLATSVVRCIDASDQELSVLATHRAKIAEMLPRVVEAAGTALSRKYCNGCFHLLGLVAEIARATLGNRDYDTQPFSLDQLEVVFLCALRVRSQAEDLSTLALICWFMLRQLQLSSKSTEVAASDDLSRRSLHPDRKSSFVTAIGLLVRDQVEALSALATNKLAAPALPMEALWESLMCGRTHGLQDAGISPDERMLALTLLEYPAESRLMLCTWISVQIIDAFTLSEDSDEVGRLFAECTNVIADVARLLSISENLPRALVAVSLRLVARSMKAFRLFASPMMNDVDTTSICRLLQSSDTSISVFAIQTLWQILRNRSSCYRFAASARSELLMHRTDIAVTKRAVQLCKELVYTGELDDRRLEAAYGVLVQLTKAHEALDEVLVMDELHPNAIFLDDPQNLLSALSPSRSPLVLLQQCKFLKHVSRCRPTAVLMKPASLNCLGEAIKKATASGRVAGVLAAGGALLSLVEAAKHLPESRLEHLRNLFTADACSALQACYRSFRELLHQLEATDAHADCLSLVRALALQSSLLFHLTSTKCTLCLRSEVVDELDAVPRTLLVALRWLRDFRTQLGTTHPGNDPRLDLAQIQRHLLRTLRRLTVVSSTLPHFRTRDPSASNEPFDMLIDLLGLPKSATSLGDHADNTYARELLLVVVHVTRDPLVAAEVVTHHSFLSSLFQFYTERTPTAILLLFWQVLHNVVELSVHVSEIMMRLATKEHIAVLLQRGDYSQPEPETQQLAHVATSTLRMITEKCSIVHALALKYSGVFNTMLRQVIASVSPSPCISRDSTVLENIAHIVAGAMRACSKDFAVFCDVLELTERLVSVIAMRTNDLVPHEAENSLHSVWPNGFRVAVERLVCALCELLLSFHEAEATKSLIPGYEIKRVDRGRSSSMADMAERVQPNSPNRTWSLCVSSKKYGVYCKGISPASNEVLRQILRIFSSVCSLHTRWRVLRRHRKRQGRPLGGRNETIVSGNCLVYVSEFFFQIAHLPSGRFVCLDPSVIQLWVHLLPHLHSHSLKRVCDGLVVCTLSKNQTLAFLSSGGLRLLVSATCKIIREAAARLQREKGRHNRTDLQETKASIAISDAFLQFTIAAAVLTERAPFLQSTFYLVHAGEEQHITVAGLVLASIIYSCGRSAYLKLACKVLGRFLCLFTLEETRAFLAACPAQMARALEWKDVGEEDVMMALITMIQETESEAIMKHRVLVSVVHSTLLRTAVLGLIDKGIPEVLHDYGLKTMAINMESLKEACHNLHAAHQNMVTMTAIEEVESSSTITRRRTSMALVMTSVEKLTAGLSAVSGAALTAGVTALLGTPFQGDDDEADSTLDPESRYQRRLARCVDALKDVVDVIDEYAISGYQHVFKNFETWNEDLELIAAMQNSGHAIALTQATFYAIEVVEEALVAALLETEEATSLSEPGAKALRGNILADSATEQDAAMAEARAFFQKLEAVLNLVAVSLQHSDIDLLFYGHKLQQLGQISEALFQLPITDEDHETGVYSVGDVDCQGLGHQREVTKPTDPAPRSLRRRPSSQLFQRNRATENGPIFLRFRSLELRSWLWCVLGFLPYLRVRQDETVQLIRFTKAQSTGRPQTPGAARTYACTFDVHGPCQDHVETSFRELPRAVAVEVWVYLPFWYRDVLVSHAKIPLLARSLETESFDFQFYPESSRGVQAYRSESLGTLTMTLSDRRVGDSTEALNDDNSFPAYSTLGSKYLWQFMRFIARVSLVTRLFDALCQRRELLTTATTQQQLDSLENDRQLDAMSASEVVEYLLSKVISVLRAMTHPDKLVAPTASAACEPLVTQLEQMVPAFGQTLARAFETKNTRVWRDAVKALSVVRQVFLEKGLQLFAAHFQNQERPAVDFSAVSPSSPSHKRKSRQDKRPSAFIGGPTPTTCASKRTLREVASQLRHVHLHKQVASLGGNVELQQAELGGGLVVPSSKLLHAMVTKNTNHSTRRVTRVLSASHLHQHVASKSEWRLIYPHVSLWSLSQTRMPQWHSLECMSAPTSLNHFLLQPIERLQTYGAVLEFVQGSVKRARERSALDTADAPANTAASTRLPSSLAMLEPKLFRKSSMRKSLSGGTAAPVHDGGLKQGPDSSMKPLASIHTSKENAVMMPSGSHSSLALPLSKSARGAKALWKKLFRLSEQVSGLTIVQKALAGASEMRDARQLEAVRARRLLKYHSMDPFDAAARLQRLFQHASRLPAPLYREGKVATFVHGGVWVLLTLTVWRVAIARDAIRDSERSFQELYTSQSAGDHDGRELLSPQPLASDANGILQDYKRRIVISGHHRRGCSQLVAERAIASTAQLLARKHQVAPHSMASDDDSDSLVNASPAGFQAASSLKTNPQLIALSEQELKHLVILLELKRLVSDIFRVWPAENGNIGLNGFWSSLWFTAIALGCPFVLVYAIFPAVLRVDPTYVRYLSYGACLYGTCWIVAAYVSIRGVTKKIPAFREVRHVERINLTDFPYSLRNYMAIASVVWDGIQLNATSFSVWKMSYKPKQLAALTTIDLQDIGLGSLEVNVFASKQSLSLVCLVVWFFCLKASNKFKSIQFLNYLLTFLLPNLLGGMLFMFLSKQFNQTVACFEDSTTNVTVMWSNSAIPCWTNEVHASYALRGLFGMSLFVPLAVLAYGSYQVFFPEVNLDVQTSPMLNVSAQIVKAAMMGALTFFVNQVQLFLAVALVGNLLLLFLVTKYDLCSTWHLKYGKVLIYAMSSWSAICAMISTFVREQQEKDRLPVYTMHAGWSVLVLLAMGQVHRRLKKNQGPNAQAQRVPIRQKTQKSGTWARKRHLPLAVAPAAVSDAHSPPSKPMPLNTE